MISSFKANLLGLGLAAYALFVLALCIALSHYPWSASKVQRTTFPAPPDFHSIDNISERKQQFFDYLRPIINAQNAFIRMQRQTLLTIEQEWRHTHKLTAKSRRQLRELCEQYKVDETEVTQQFKLLKLRVDEIPEALALAQAASESAWGTSRFARQANNYFGQWCFEQGCGIVPKRRASSATHEVAKFANTEASVDAYFTNINTFRAYKKLRATRLQLSQSNTTITAHALLPTLTEYSERGEAYIKDLRAIIKQNSLE